MDGKRGRGAISYSIDTSVVDRKFRKLAREVKDASRPLKAFAVGFEFRKAQAWKVTFGKAWGGIARFQDVFWKPPAPLYVRKDGNRIPPWGGVPKKHGSGKVKGRKRPSGSRVKRSDVLMQDTGHMRSGFLLGKIAPNRRSVVFDFRERYGKIQNRMRKFAFFTAKDRSEFRRIMNDWLRALAAAMNRRARRAT